MGSAVPMPDADTQKFLADARSQAVEGLKGQFPDSMLAPPPPPQSSMHATPGTISSGPAPGTAPMPGPNSVPIVNDEAPPPPPPPAPVEQPGFLADEFKGTGRVVANHIMAGLSAIGGALGRGGTGMAMADDPAHAEDAARAGHDYVDQVTDDAHAAWLKGANDEAAGGGAQVLGSVAESLPSMVAGAVGMPILAADQREHELQLQGIDPKTAAKEALVTAIATAAGLKISHAFPGLTKWVRGTLQHLATGAVGNTAVQAGQDALDKYILKDDGFKEAADQIDPTDPSTIAKSGIMGTIYGLINSFTHAPAKTAKPIVSKEPTPGTGEPPPPPGPSPTAQPIVAGEPPTPPPAAATPAPTAKPITAPPVPDVPSVEPLSDLKAQVADMKSPDTARKHVYLSADNVTALGPDGVKALADGAPTTKNFDKTGGVLISQNISERSKAARLRMVNGDDMQATLGALTGAGDGKSPENTVVVQGQTPEGAVVKEATVAPADVPKAVVAAGAEGHTPVVTTPEAAIARRAAGAQSDTDFTGAFKSDVPNGYTQDLRKKMWTAYQVGTSEVVRGVKDPLVAKALRAPGMSRTEFEQFLDSDGKVKPSTPAAAAQVSPEPSKSASPAEGSVPATAEPTTPKVGARHILSIAGEDVPVIVAGDTVGNKTPVHTIDEDGVISKETRNVPADMFKPKEGTALSDMSQTKEQRALERERVASARAREAGMEPEFTPEPVPPNAAAREGEAARRDAQPIKKAADIEEQPSAENAPQISGEYKPGSPHYEADLEKQQRSQGSPARKAALDKFNESQKALREKMEPDGIAPDLETKQPLEQAAAFYDKSNVPPPGKKFADSVSDHAGRVAALARALKTGLKEFPDADAAVLRHANAAADRVLNIDSKSEENMKHNRGVGHGMLDQRAADLMQAIHNLTHPDSVKIPEPVQTKAASLSERLAKVREEKLGYQITALSPGALLKDTVVLKSPHLAKLEALKEKTVSEKLKAKQAEKVPSGIKNVEDFSKPKVLNAGDKTRLGAAIGRYMRVDPDDIQGAHDNLARVLHEVYGDERAKERDDLLNLVREQRNDEREEHANSRKGLLSSTVDDDEFRGKHEDVETPDEANEERAVPTGEPKSPDNREILALHAKLPNFWKAMGEKAAAGESVRSRNVLNHMLSAAEPGSAAEDLLRKMRDNLPDTQVSPVSTLTDSKGNPANGRGMHFMRDNSVQVVTRPGEITYRNTRTVLHELAHAGTAQFVRDNPDHPLSVEVRRLYDIAKTRMGDMVDEAREQGRVIYGMRNDVSFAGEVPSAGHFYGMHNVYEMMAEAQVNPNFQRLLAESERFARNSEGLRDVISRYANKVAEFLGLKNPRSARLLHNILDVTDQIMEADRDWRNGHTAALERITENMEKLEDPPALQHEDRYRAVVGDVGTALARGFRTTMRSGLIEGLRRTTRALTPYDGMVRAQLRRGTFGPDAPGNPLRDYDEAVQNRNAAINKMTDRANPVVAQRAKLSSADNRKLGQFQDDVGTHGFSIDKAAADQTKAIQADPKFAQKFADMQARWKNLSPEQQSVYRAERDYNEWAARQSRKASVDLATDAFSDKDITKAQRSMLYSAHDPGDFEQLIGPGKMIDVGDRNDNLREALKEISSTNEIEGDYFHKGRSGDYVVQVRPEVDRSFKSQAEAQAHAAQIEGLSQGSTAKVEEIGGQWHVTGKAEYVSMHERIADAEKEAARLQKAGLDVGSATQKIMSASNADLSSGFQSIYAEASRRLDRRLGVDFSTDKAIEDTKQSLRQAFLNQMAARSAYSGSKLARRNVGGVKADEMGRNFGQHAQSQAWNTGHMATVLKTGDALGRLREATKDDTQSQGRALQRGRIYDEIQKRLRQEVAQYGSHQPLNAAVAKLGFLNYMTSGSHALLYMTQNFTTAIPVAGARFGYGKSLSAFGSAMRMISAPAFRETYRAMVPFGQHGDVNTIQRAILGAVAKDPRFGKWAKGGENSPLQQLIDRGIIHTSLSNQMAMVAKGGNQFANKVMEYARITAAMADMFNRVSTGVAALELHKGDIYKAGDFVKETHVDYSQENKPRAYKAVGKLWGGNSVTMFRSYITGMTHLLYSHVYDSMAGGTESGRGQALKTVAGLMVGTMLFAGVEKGFGLEPIRMAMDVYHHLVGDNDEYYSFDNSARRAVQGFAGDGKLAETINGGLPRLLGIDMSSRMGLSDLFFHDPPDLLSLKPKGVMDMAGQLLGAGLEEASSTYDNFNQAAETGRLNDWMKLIPVKAVQNVFDAYKAGTTGKVTASGAQITEPSASAAIIHGIGFRTAEEAKLAEKAQTEADYKGWVENRKYMFLKEWASAPIEDRQDVQDKINAFNEANPGHRINAGDKIKAQRGIYNTEREAAGLPGRDPVVNELRDH